MHLYQILMPAAILQEGTEGHLDLPFPKSQIYSTPSVLLVDSLQKKRRLFNRPAEGLRLEASSTVLFAGYPCDRPFPDPANQAAFLD
jgi:hypothetical protein